MRLFSGTRKSLISRPGSPFVLCHWLFAILLVFFCSPAFPAESEIQQLAAEAKQRFNRVMQPPIFENPLVTHAFFLAPTTPHRDYVVKCFGEAIDALVAEAERPGQITVVTNALRDLVKHGETEAIDHVFSEMLERTLADKKTPNPQAAAVLRHSVALVELPIALQPTTFPTLHPVMLSPFVRLTLNGALSNTSGIEPMPGPKTLPAYLKAAELEPGHLWTWIVIANLAQQPQDSEKALARAEEIAQAKNDRHALVFVKLELGRLANNFKLPGKATQAFKDAVSTASKGLAAYPGDDAWKHDLASAFISLGTCLETCLETSQMGPKEHAEAITLLADAVALRSQLVADHPENSRLSLELAVAHSRLANAHRRVHRLLSGKSEDTIESKKHSVEAERIYNALTVSDGLKPTLHLNTGVFASVLMQAGGLTLTVGLVLIFLYRRRIASLMREASSTKTVFATDAGQAAGQILGQAREIEFVCLPSKARAQSASFASAQMVTSHRHFRRATWGYVLGGAAFAVIASILFLTLGKIEIGYFRLIATSLNYIWPVVLTLWLLWGQDRKRLAVTLFVYFGILLAVCVRVALSDTPTLNAYGMMVPAFFQPLILWLLTVSPSLFLLLFLNRHIRAVGSVLLVLMMTLMAGATLMMFIGSSREGMNAWVDFSLWVQSVSGISLGIIGLQILGALLIAPIGGWLVLGLCQKYEKKRYSEMTLIIDSIWLFETVILCIDLSHNEGQGYWLGLAAFMAYKAITYFGLRPMAQEAIQIAPARLLLLRVFGFKRRTERLFKLLEARWRYAGPIQLIAAPDLASSTADPGDFLSFITGNLRNQFIIDPGDIEQRLANMDYAPDPDGRYRVNEIFCGNDAWRPVVQQLMVGSDLVVMDLRGFSAKNQGCLFELQALVDYVPFDRIVLLVDDKTDIVLLSQTLATQWQQTFSTSPNAQATGIISILTVSKWDEEAIDTLLDVADGRLSGPDNIPTSRPLPFHAAT
jgi:hypothetical protein